jgi:hypothetical protein
MQACPPLLTHLNLCNCQAIGSAVVDSLRLLGSLRFLNIDGAGGGGIENQFGGCFGLLSKSGDAQPIKGTEFMRLLRGLTSVDLASSSIRSLRGLQHLERLNHLCLAECSSLTPYALSCLPQYGLPCLSTLILFNVEAATDETCAAIITAFPTLSHLDLTKTKAGDISLEAVGNAQAWSREGARLETLNMRKCTSVSDEGLRMMAESFEAAPTGLRGTRKNSLYIIEINTGVGATSAGGLGTGAPMARRQSQRWSKREFDSNGEVVLQGAPAALPIERSRSDSNTPHLSRLDLMGCKKITDTGLWHICRLRSLTALDLSWCDRLSNGGAECLQRLKRLRYLSLLGCHHVTDGVVVALRTTKTLECLNLKWCRNVTDVSLVALAQLPRLRTLCLKGCEKITDEGVVEIAEKAVLTALNISLCKEVTYRGVECIRAFCNVQELLIAVSPDAPSSEFVKNERRSYF